jgi:hypothetical protein
MELSTDYTNTFQIVLVGMGLIILFVGTLACCCTVKAQSSLLYLVSHYQLSVACGSKVDLIMKICILSVPQYAGFLTIILVIELAIAASLYMYKDHLADGLQKGLNQSIRNYGPEFVMKSADFDAMQENVNFFMNFLSRPVAMKFEFLNNSILSKNYAHVLSLSLFLSCFLLAVGMLWQR